MPEFYEKGAQKFARLPIRIDHSFRSIPKPKWLRVKALSILSMMSCFGLPKYYRGAGRGVLIPEVSYLRGACAASCGRRFEQDKNKHKFSFLQIKESKK